MIYLIISPLAFSKAMMSLSLINEWSVCKFSIFSYLIYGNEDGSQYPKTLVGLEAGHLFRILLLALAYLKNTLFACWKKQSLMVSCCDYDTNPIHMSPNSIGLLQSNGVHFPLVSNPFWHCFAFFFKK